MIPHIANDLTCIASAIPHQLGIGIGIKGLGAGTKGGRGANQQIGAAAAAMAGTLTGGGYAVKPARCHLIGGTYGTYTLLGDWAKTFRPIAQHRKFDAAIEISMEAGS